MSTTVRYEKTKHSGIRKRTWLATGEVTFQVRWTTSNGRRLSATRDTLREAIELLDEMKRQLRVGGTADPTRSRMTYGEHFERWHPTKDIKPSTRDAEASYYQNHIAPYWAHVPLGDINPFDVEEWLAELVPRLRTASTRRKVFRIFGQPIRQLVRRGVLIADPLADVTPPKVERVEARFLEEREWLLIEEGIHPHWRQVVPFTIDTGLRIGEFAYVRVNQIDFDRLTVRVAGTVSVDKGKRIEHGPKTYAGTRVVPMLTEPVAASLESMIRERGLGPRDHLFTGPKNGLLTPSNWRTQVWNPAVERAGIELPATPHAMRHTAISRWIRAGATPPQVQSWAGHSSSTITFDRYGHFFEQDVTNVRKRLEGG
ncbi:MAG: site-specific integrase [Acidimicrobiales bacterium]|nr:site-specific integrase [Acidimicrobiales bacterium]